MDEKNNKENSIKVVYGNGNLKDIVTNMLEKIMIDKIQKSENEWIFLIYTFY